MVAGVEGPKSDPAKVAAAALDGVEQAWSKSSATS